MEQPTCGTCPYWVYVDEKLDRLGAEDFADLFALGIDLEDQSHPMYDMDGFCHRWPPSIDRGRTDGPDGYTTVNAVGDWCGEHPDFPEYVASLKENR